MISLLFYVGLIKIHKKIMENNGQVFFKNRKFRLKVSSYEWILHALVVDVTKFTKKHVTPQKKQELGDLVINYAN